jgi:sugar phosphate isomerase/epimerase
MGKFRIACHLIQFGKEFGEDPARVLRAIATAGYDGVEGIRADDPARELELCALAKQFGLQPINAGGGTFAHKAQWNAVLGNGAAEVPSQRRKARGEPLGDPQLRAAADALAEPLAICRRHRLRGFHHAHLGTYIETVEDARRLLAAVPDLWLLYDTGHLLAAGSNPLDVFRSEVAYRIGHVHLKDFHADDPRAWDYRSGKFGEQARFAELGRGSAGFDVAAALAELERVGYAGWVSVELDRPWPTPSAAEAAANNRAYLRSLGY